jgi:hypothetical protein
MDINSWLTLAAVLVALGLGVWANIQTQRIKAEENRREKRERKELLLNEMKDWTDKLTRKCASINSVFFSDDFSDNDVTEKLFNAYMTHGTEFDLEDVNLVYFKTIASIFSSTLQGSINQIESKLNTLKLKIVNDAQLVQEWHDKIENNKNRQDTETITKNLTAVYGIIREFRHQIKDLDSEIAKAKLALLKEK